MNQFSLFSRSSYRHFMVSLCVCIPVYAQSQEIEFADDFSSDSISFSTSSFGNSSGFNAATGIDGGIEMSAASDGTGYSNRWLAVGGVTDTLSVTGRLTSDSRVTSTTDGQSSAILRVEGNFYNDLGTETGDELGNVNGNIEMRLNADGSVTFNGCVSRYNGADHENLNIFENGTSSCFNVDSKTGSLDTDYTLGYRVDREQKTVTFFVDDVSVVGEFTTSAYPVSYVRAGVQVIQESGDGLVVGQVSGIATDTTTIDLTGTMPVPDRYRSVDHYDGLSQSLTLVDEQARITANTNETDGGSSAELWLATNGEYIESTMAISSESRMTDGRSRVDSIMKLVAYNDTADGGVDGQLGDVEARVMLRASGSGQRSAEYCLFRADDAEFNSSIGLLDDGEACIYLPVTIELDRAYRASISLDRTSNVMTFRLDGQRIDVAIASGVFQTDSPRRYVGARANGNAMAVVMVDDVRTSSSALTATETTNAISTAPVFPDAPDPASLQVDSTLTATQPFNGTLDFVDDFSSDTSLFGFWGGRSRGESAVGYRNGALELQTNSAPGNEEEGNYTEFYLGGGASDSISALVSLSSDTRLPPGARSKASVQVRLRAMNDTQDGGFNNEEGDIEASMSIDRRGDGTFEMNVEIRRRQESGGSDQIVRLSELPEFQEMTNLVPAFDTPYQLSMTLDRERGVMIYQLDDMVAEYALGTGIFKPYRGNQIVQTSHRGASGAAIAHLYTIETDNFSEDFTTGAPLLAPYAAGFDSQYQGVEVSIDQERVRFDVDSSITPDRDARIRVLGASDYIGASIELSSQSLLSSGGEVFVGLTGTLYNDLFDNPANSNGNEGNVASLLRLSHHEVPDSGGQVETTAYYCAFRANSVDFSDSIELLGGDPENCPRFTTVAALDTIYTASIELDRETSQLIYTFAGEVQVYDIPTAIYDVAEPYRDVRARARQGSQVVAYADDLTVAADPVPLTLSNSLLSTQIAASTVTPESEAENTTGTNGQRQRRVCLDVTSDTDGDGWGWEDNMSCIVGQSQAQQFLILDIPPVCSAAAIAIDDMGWGWENNATCIEEGSYAQSLQQR